MTRDGGKGLLARCARRSFAVPKISNKLLSFLLALGSLLADGDLEEMGAFRIALFGEGRKSGSVVSLGILQPALALFCSAQEEWTDLWARHIFSRQTR